MKKLLFFLLCFVLASMSHAQHYQLSPDKSTVAWAGKAAFSTYTLSGAIEAKSGKLSWGEGRIQDAFLVIDMLSIESDIAQLTDHLRSADFFEVKRFPEATFALSQPVSLKAEEDGLAGGELTIKGITKEEKVPLKVRRQGKTIVLEGKAVIDRTAYEIYYNSPNFFSNLKQNAIADEFELAFTLVFETDEAK